jgi:hypothetical protein
LRDFVRSEGCGYFLANPFRCHILTPYAAPEGARIVINPATHV